MIPKKRPDKLPIIDSFIAREPYPFLTKSWPGSNAKVESPGIPRNKPGKYPFAGLNNLSESSYEKFEERLNLLFNLNYEDYTKKLEKKHTYLMHNSDTFENILEFLKKNTDPL